MNAPRRSLLSPPAGSAARARQWSRRGIFALLLIATVVAYFPSLRGEFLWDDAGHVTSPALQGATGLGRIWFEPGVTQQYYPLLHSAFWVEHQLWGDAALGYHCINLLWHAISACLLVALLRRLAVPGALLAGVLFAIHPVGVESVAWISEQKNTLSTLCYLAAALAWLRYEEDRRPGPYAIATLWFLAALLTKTVTATLPAALLVVAWWRRGRLAWRTDVLPLLPWFAAGTAMGLFTAWFERTGIGAGGADFDLNLVDRTLVAGRVFWFYLGKLVWPANLTFFYPRWHIDPAAAWQYVFPAAALALAGVLVWWARQGNSRGPLAVLLLFGGTLFPVLGFLNVYPFVFSYVADHFQYLASLSVFALLAAGFTRAVEHGWLGRTRRTAVVGAVAVVFALGALTRAQSKQYVDPLTLYRTTVARSPDSWVAHHNLASELAARGESVAAVQQARSAVELKPDYAPALNNLALDLTRTGQPAEALPLAERALRLQPRYADAENTWGIALVTLGRVDEAIPHFQHAVALEPNLADGHYNLGLANAQRGDFTAAIPQFAETVRLRPDHVGAELNWGVALALTQGLATARPHLERAASLDPDSAVLHQTYGRVLLNAGDYRGAEEQLRDALRCDPNLPGAETELAAVVQRSGSRHAD